MRTLTIHININPKNRIMKLQEIAFMSELIKKTYRRRMNILLVNIAIMFSSIPATIQFSFSYLFTTLFVAVYLIVLFLYYLGVDDNNDLPWAIKKRQARALNDFQKADFDQLKFSVPLKEYFQV